jgi:hypothetical protein
MAVDKQVFESFVSRDETAEFEEMEDDDEYYTPVIYDLESYYY